MNDRAVALLEQYEIEVLRTRKGRGAILCDTQQGCLIFKEYTGREEQLRLQEQVLKHLEERGTVPAERLLATKEGALSVTDRDGVRYILKTWWEGRECNIRDREECMEAMRLLARLHGDLEFTPVFPETEETSAPVIERYLPSRDYEKHNRELKRARRFLKQRSQKTWFEIRLSAVIDPFLEEARQLCEEWKENDMRTELFAESMVELMEKKILLDILQEALDSLMTEEKELAVKVFGEEVSVYEFARMNGGNIRTLDFRKNKVLEKLRRFFRERGIDV